MHGATGLTGRLVCAALKRRGVGFAVSGRSADRLRALGDRLGIGERIALRSDAADGAGVGSIEQALRGRTIVCACAGPFVDVGEPILAACARLGVRYLDTTGEQTFVAGAIERHDAAARANGVACVPAMAYEIAPSDWAAHLAAEAVGGAPDILEMAYAARGSKGALAASRGTKKSALGMLAAGGAKAWVDGALVDERPATHVRAFELGPERTRATAVSFPSPEALVVPPHTHARTVRTYLVVGSSLARAMQATRAVAPAVARLLRNRIVRSIDKGAEGPSAEERAATRFEIVCEATKGQRRARVLVRGRDPYGLTAELQAWAAERALAGEMRGAGVVAPSVAFDARAGFEAMKPFGVELIVQET